MSDGCIRYEAAEGIATIVIDRPARRNALNALMCEQLQAALERLRDGEERVGILAAEGATFCAGADLGAPPAEFWRAVPGLGVELDKPLIAAVQGPVVGLGLTITAFCDLCVAADDARFVYPEAKVGISKGVISALAARVPHKIAMELMLLGGPLDAARAFDVGFVNRVVPAGDQLRAAREMAAALAESAPLVLAQLKGLARETLPRSPVEVMYRTTAISDKVAASRDASEGLLAFREKRAPRYEGR